MLYKTLTALVALTGLLPSLYSESPVKLQYMSSEPVEMVSSHSFNLDQLIPGLEFTAEGSQTITSQLTLENRGSLLKNVRLPFMLTWTLKAIEINLIANGGHLSFDSRNPKDSFVSKELSKWTGRTLHLTIDEQLALERNNEEIERLGKQLPAGGELNPYALVEGVLQPLFALADRELVNDAVISRKSVHGDLGMAYSTLDYRITEITESMVKAVFSGNIEKKSVPLNTIWMGSENSMGMLQLSVTGTVQGTIQWDRANALLCKMDSENIYKCAVSFLGMEWPLTVRLKSNLLTKPLIVAAAIDAKH